MCWGGWEVFWEEIVRLVGSSWWGWLALYQLLVDRGGQECPPHTSIIHAGVHITSESRRDAGATLMLVAAAEVVDEHLFDRLVVGH